MKRATGCDGADIALVLSDLGSGGAQRVALALARHWHGAGRRVTLVTLAGSDGDFHAVPAGIRRIAVGGIGTSNGLLAGLAANLRRLVRLRRALRGVGAPVVVAFIAPLAVQVVLACAGTGIRVVAAERNDPARQSFGPVWDWLRRRVFPHAALVTANSAGALTSLATFVPDHKLALTPNPLPEPATGPVIDNGGRMILAIARLHRQKGLDVLIAATAMAGNDLAGWHVAILGEGTERPALEAQAEALGLGNRILFAGAVADPTPWLRGAAIFALPSRYEGMPNAMLEALSFGRPVVVTDASPGPLQWVEDGVTGLVVPADDARALAAALVRLARDDDLRHRLGAAAARRMAAARQNDDALARWEVALGWRQTVPA